MVLNRGKVRIPELVIKCDNHQQGCECVGKFKELYQHLTICTFAPATCPFCNVAGAYYNIENHLSACAKQQFSCSLCGNRFYGEAFDKHACPSVIIKCNACKKEMSPAAWNVHNKQCPFRLEKCPNHVYGCVYVGHANNIEQHIAQMDACQGLSLQLVIGQINALKQEIAAAKEK